MSKRFKIIFFSALAVCILLTAAHLVYDYFAYQHCSIIYFISKELW